MKLTAPLSSGAYRMSERKRNSEQYPLTFIDFACWVYISCSYVARNGTGVLSLPPSPQTNLNPCNSWGFCGRGGKQTERRQSRSKTNHRRCLLNAVHFSTVGLTLKLEKPLNQISCLCPWLAVPGTRLDGSLGGITGIFSTIRFFVSLKSLLMRKLKSRWGTSS